MLTPLSRRSTALASVTLAAAVFPLACGSSATTIQSPDSSANGGSVDSGGAAPRTQQPKGWDEGIRLPEAIDINPDPSIVEVNLDAKLATLSFVPGGPTTAWTYNGQVPGPLIRANVGDRVIVHFTNHLPEDTSIHWHGLRISNAMDGMPGISQPPVSTGGSFDYDFVVPDAATFWYHPHVDSAAQVGFGMYAPFIVEDPKEPAGLGDEVVLVLSDLSVDPDGTLAPATVSGDFGTLFGREGTVLLVNGKVRPTLKARPGRAQRWRIINAARTHYFQISLPGHTFLRIGGDGGLMASPVTVAQPVLAPAERADLMVVPSGEPGADVVARGIPYDRGFGVVNQSTQDLFVVHLEGDPVTAQPLPDIHRDIQPIDISTASLVSLTLTQDSITPLELGINGVPFSRSQPVIAKVGDTQVWEITNTMQFAHPFHLHGFFFQVVSPKGPQDPLEWKDTVNVPVNGTVQFAVHYDNRAGMWMFHCHILDHAEAGMMGTLMLTEPEMN